MSPRPSLSVLGLDSAQGQGESRDAVAHAAADALAANSVALVRLGAALSKEQAIRRAGRTLQAVRSRLTRDHGLPAAAYVEQDEESHGVPVTPFHSRRFLLPHQDGGHSSFLTPSRHDCPDAKPDDRAFSASVYWRRPSHKLFQGFLVTNTGVPAGTTYYYDALALLRDAFTHRHGRPASDIAELGAFALRNIRRARNLARDHGSRYLTPGGFLGAGNPAFHLLPSGPRAESHFWPAQYAALPDLFLLAERCGCGDCTGPGDRVLCHALTDALGLSWPQVRARYETAVAARTHDLLLANNLTMFHAAESGADRTLIPFCLVVDRAEGDEYEAWLARQWRERAGHEAAP